MNHGALLAVPVTSAIALTFAVGMLAETISRRLRAAHDEGANAPGSPRPG